MSKPLEIASGTRFGHLTALHNTGSDKRGRQLFKFRCDCGKEVIKRAGRVARGKIKACGYSCQLRASPSNYVTGLSNPPHPIYRAWSRMHTRCYNKALPEYVHYGGRGIQVCSAWHDFVEFFADMAPSWEPHKSLDRLDNTLGYSSENCRWASSIQQCNNRRSNRQVETPEGPMTLAQAARRYKIPYATLQYRLNKDWEVFDALTRPLQSRS